MDELLVGVIVSLVLLIKELLAKFVFKTKPVDRPSTCVEIRRINDAIMGQLKANAGALAELRKDGREDRSDLKALINATTRLIEKMESLAMRFDTMIMLESRRGQ